MKKKLMHFLAYSTSLQMETQSHHILTLEQLDYGYGTLCILIRNLKLNLLCIDPPAKSHSRQNRVATH